MKILIIMGEHIDKRIGGAEVQVDMLVQYFIKNGHEIIYLFKDEKRRQYYRVGDVSYYSVKRAFKGVKLLHYLNIRFINKVIRDEKPSIIYQRGDFHFADIIVRLGKWNKIPVVSGISMERSCYLEKIQINHKIILSLLNRWMKKSYYRKSTLVISQTRKQRNLLKRNYCVESIIIPNGHPIPEGPFMKSDPVEIVWVANIKPIKQPLKFIQLANSMKALPIRFIMIGRRDDGLLQKEVEEELSKAKNIDYIGEITLDEANEYIEKATLLVNTSISEGFSNTFIQAWMRETPVVSLNSDPDGVITREKLGYLSRDIKKMKEDIKHYLNLKEKEKSIFRKRVREFANTNYNIEKTGEEHLRAFSKCIND